ncbi:MAG: LysR family transcriptional regulator [Labrys sp. (in: a-proteobacteria)]|jgi:DNA-binding transcriptional LysR family regulator
MHDVDTALLRTFVGLAATGSFSRTGLRVGRSQSAVSGQIKKLEAIVGRTLLDRDTRNVRLTADGAAMLVHARQMIRLADAMIERFRDADIEGRVRFGTPEDFASAYLPEILGAFAVAHDRVQLHVSCDLTLRLIAQFEAGEHDLVIIKQDPATPHKGARILWREQLVWVAPPDERSSFEALRTGFAARGRPLPLVVAPSPCVYRSRAAVALDRRDIPWTAVYTSQSQAGTVAAVKAGLGYAVMPRAMVPADLAALDEAHGWPTLSPAEICLLVGARPSPATAALARFIEAQAPGAAQRRPEEAISPSAPDES